METPNFIDVPEWDREEAKDVAGRGGGGADGVGLLGVWYTTSGSLFVLLLGMNVVVH